MAITTIGDVYNQPVLSSYMTEDSVEKTAFYQSGVLASNGVITELANGPSNEIVVPFWNPISANVEPNYSNDVYEDEAVPRAINTGTQRARVAYLNEGFGSADLVAELTNQDPLQSVANRLQKFWMQQAQRRVIASTVGIYNDNVANHDSDMVFDNGGNVISATDFIDADATFGDFTDELGAYAMHSIVYNQLRKQQLIDFVRDAENNTQFATYGGKRVVVDDGMPVFGTGATRTFLTVAFGAGAFGYGEGSPKMPLEYDRAPQRGNGGGVEVLWSRKTMIIHPFGYQFTSDTITGNTTESNPMSASWADLALADNWNRVVDRKSIPMAFIVSGLTEA